MSHLPPMLFQCPHFVRCFAPFHFDGLGSMRVGVMVRGDPELLFHKHSITRNTDMVHLGRISD